MCLITNCGYLKAQKPAHELKEDYKRVYSINTYKTNTIKKHIEKRYTNNKS